METMEINGEISLSIYKTHITVCDLRLSKDLPFVIPCKHHSIHSGDEMMPRFT